MLSEDGQKLMNQLASKAVAEGHAMWGFLLNEAADECLSFSYPDLPREIFINYLALALEGMTGQKWEPQSRIEDFDRPKIKLIHEA